MGKMLLVGKWIVMETSQGVAICGYRTRLHRVLPDASITKNQSSLHTLYGIRTDILEAQTGMLMVVIDAPAHPIFYPSLFFLRLFCLLISCFKIK